MAGIAWSCFSSRKLHVFSPKGGTADGIAKASCPKIPDRGDTLSDDKASTGAIAASRLGLRIEKAPVAKGRFERSALENLRREKAIESPEYLRFCSDEARYVALPDQFLKLFLDLEGSHVPVPAAVIAWRITPAWTSPQAYTPCSCTPCRVVNAPLLYKDAALTAIAQHCNEADNAIKGLQLLISQTLSCRSEGKCPVI